MDRLHSPSALQDESRAGIGENISREPDPIGEDTQDADDLDTWLLFVSGSLAATLMAGFLCGLPQPHHITEFILFFQAVGYIVFTMAAGVVGMWIPWFFFGARSSFNPRLLSRNVAVGWVFLPCILLLYRRQSLWMFLVIALATVATAISLRRLLPSSVEQSFDKPSYPPIGDLPNLYGLPIVDFQPLRVFFIALCAQAALIFVIAGDLLLAALLLSTCLSLLIWRWTAFDRTVTGRFTGRRSPVLLCGFALILTIFVLMPAIHGGLRDALGQNDHPHKPPSVASQPAESGRPSSDYVGIVLWPPPIKKTKIIPPTPPAPSVVPGAAARPVVIPFDGPYWYFKAPSKRPGPLAHVAHGNSTDVNIRSDNWAPLLMEAHQNLGTSIDPKCCTEIDVALTNADDRSGKISLGVLLTDSNSLGKPFQYLGERAIVSSEAAQIALDRSPVKEVLRFPISRSATVHRFNEITIVFLPAKERARGGAKVSIQSFTLIPR